MFFALANMVYTLDHTSMGLLLLGNKTVPSQSSIGGIDFRELFGLRCNNSQAIAANATMVPCWRTKEPSVRRPPITPWS